MITPADAKPGDALPSSERSCDEIQSFFYNAALWNAHRIHFDLPYATNVEGYDGLVVPGPLIGDWMVQVVDEWIDGTDALIKRIEYSNRLACYTGDVVIAGGTVESVNGNEITISLYVKNSDGDVVTPGTAVVQLG